MNKETLRESAMRHPGAVLPPFDAIMNLDGFDAICAIAEHLGGRNTYVPSLRTIFGRCLEADARREYNGSRSKSLAALSQKYGYTERHLRRLIAEKNQAPA